MKIVTDDNNGEEVCSSCGQILVEKLEDPTESIFDVEDYFNLSRTGPPNSIARHDYGLYTIIGRKNVDAFGKNISGKLGREFSRLRLWDGRSQAKPQGKTLMKGLMLLDRTKKKLFLPEQAIENAAFLYRKAISLGLAKGRGAEEILAGCIYLVCKQEKIPRSLQDVCSVTFLNKGRMYSAVRQLVETFDIVLDPLEVADYFPKIASAVGLSKKSQKYAYELFKKIKDSRIGSGKSPLVLCGSVAWIASARCGDWISQQTIADAAGITSVSIRHCSKILAEKFPDKP